MSEKRINVVIIHSSFVIGGAENMVYELAKNLDPQKTNVTVITLHSRIGTELEKKVDIAGINVIYVGCEGSVTPKKLLKVYKLIKKAKPDVIHAHMSGVIYSLPWVLTHRCKLVVTAHTTPDVAFNKRTTSLLKFFAKRNKVVMVAVSEENKTLMTAHYGLNENQVKSINNGVEIEKYYHSPHKKICFINVGRHDKNKNQALIIRLFAKLSEKYSDITLTLCGDGPERQNNIDLANELNISDKVTFTGNVGNVEDFLALSDIYVQASHREGLPLSTVEAMASYLPVITTDVGGMKNLIDNNGMLVADGDEDGYFEAMEKLVADKALREQYGKTSKKLAQSFSSKNMADKYTELYLSCRR